MTKIYCTTTGEVIRPSIGPWGKMVYVHVWMTMPTFIISKFNMLKNLVILSFLSEGFANWLKRQFWNIIYNGKCLNFFASSSPKLESHVPCFFNCIHVHLLSKLWSGDLARQGLIKVCNFNVEITIGDTVWGISWENG